MSLNLNVISVDNSQPNQKMEHEFDVNGGTIGRKFSNDWVLSDEDRHLSGNHAKIESVNGDFFLVDTSTNGVFIDGSSSPLGRGERVKLNDGMRVGMGGYDIAVSLVVEKTVELDISEGSRQDNDPFESWDTGSVIDTDKVGSDFGELIEKKSGKSQKLASDDPFFDFGEFIPDDDNEIQQDHKEIRQDNLPDFDSYFKPADVKKNIKKKEQEVSVKVEKEHEHEHEPEASQKVSEKDQDDSIIPDDWGTGTSGSIDDLLSGIDERLEITEDVIFSDPEISINEEKPEVDTQKVDPLDIQTSNEKIFVEQDEAIDDPFSELDDPEIIEAFSTQEKQASPPEVNSGPVLKEEERNNNSNNHNYIDHSETNSIAAFLKGAGLDENLLLNGTTEQQMFLVGKLFRTAIQGTMEVLRSRAEIKNEMRMDMTTIQPIQNNPIKFAVDTNEALQRLLVPTNKSYMDPEQALNESYDDIKAHQVAVIAGVQSSLVHVLKRFEPEKLIKRLEEESPISASIPIHRQAKLWNKFEDLYEAIEGEAEDDFNRLFGLEFAKAYDEQVALLKKKRSS